MYMFESKDLRYLGKLSYFIAKVTRLFETNHIYDIRQQAQLVFIPLQINKLINVAFCFLK